MAAHEIGYQVLFQPEFGWLPGTFGAEDLTSGFAEANTRGDTCSGHFQCPDRGETNSFKSVASLAQQIIEADARTDEYF